MFMKVANARKNRNKGFSLIELIIVIAIMVALVAVMAPQFIKYVQKSRNASLKSAADDYLSTVKAMYIDEESNVDKKAGTITLSAATGTLVITPADGITDVAAFNSAAGVADNTKMGATTVKYIITIAQNGADWSFKLESQADT